jgi:putative membrane protein
MLLPGPDGAFAGRRVTSAAPRSILFSMLAALLVRWALLGAAFAVTAWLLSGMDISGGFWGYVWVSALFGIVNAIIGTILRIITLPLTLLTLGLFSILVNAFLLQITDAITNNLTIDEFFWTAIWAAIIMSIVSVILDIMVSAVWRPRPATA